MKGHIPSKTDPTTAGIDPVKNGVNPFDNEGIQPNAKVPSGEKETNVTTPESHSSPVPKATGSGY